MKEGIGMPSVKIKKITGRSSLITDPRSKHLDPLLRTLALEAEAILKTSFVVAASGSAPQASGQLDEICRDFLASRPADARLNYERDAQQLLSETAAVRRAFLGPLNDTIDVSDYAVRGSDQFILRTLDELPGEDVASILLSDHLRSAASVRPSSVLDLPDKLSPLVIRKRLPDELKARFGAIKNEQEEAADRQAGLRFTKMRMFLRWVQIIDDTDEIGSDEINMGGIYTSADGRTTDVVREFTVFGDADAGEGPNEYGWSKVFAEWDLLTEPSGFPYVYSAIVTMAEKDDGGFAEFLRKLWEYVGEIVKKAIGGAVGSAVGAAIGSAIPGVGTAVGAIVGFAIGLFVEWLLGLFDNEDDILGVAPVVVSLGDATGSYYEWAGLSGEHGLGHHIDFTGHDGHYRASIAYRVFAD